MIQLFSSAMYVQIVCFYFNFFANSVAGCIFWLSKIKVVVNPYFFYSLEYHRSLSLIHVLRQFNPTETPFVILSLSL